MARPNGSRNIRGWMVTPTEMAKSGLIDPADLERVTQGGAEVTALKASATAKIDDIIKDYKAYKNDKHFLSSAPIYKIDLALAAKKVEKTTPSSRVERRVKSEEKRIRNNGYETLIVVTKEGEVLRQKGEAFSVSASKEQMSKIAGSIVTHNHPSSITGEQTRNNPVAVLIGGSSFSTNDVVNTYLRAEGEKRAVTPKLEFSLKNNNWEARRFEYISGNKSKWMGDGNRFKQAYTSSKEKTRRQIHNLVNVKKMTQEDADAAYWHLVARDFSSSK